jgi:hypothetical protein
MADRYNSRYGTGECVHIKAECRQPIPNLETTCQIHHLHEEENMLISRTREKSAVRDFTEP